MTCRTRTKKTQFSDGSDKTGADFRWIFPVERRAMTVGKKIIILKYNYNNYKK
jgi:hypothetical protein